MGSLPAASPVPGLSMLWLPFALCLFWERPTCLSSLTGLSRPTFSQWGESAERWGPLFWGLIPETRHEPRERVMDGKIAISTHCVQFRIRVKVSYH